MFNFQGSELIIILLLALVVLGPEKLPDAMRRLGRFYADLKKMSSGFQEEFRAAVDEPTRELRETANTLRDSLDFRKLHDGERPEKPKSAEMAPQPAADHDHDSDKTGDGALRPADGARAAGNGSDPAAERHAAIVNQTSTPPPPPAPFSSSQAISAKPSVPTEREPEPGVEPKSPQLAPQVAVDDEHGLREARPADRDGAT